MLSKDLLDIEIDFAKRAFELEPLPLEVALLKYTSLYGALFVPAPNYPEKDPKQEIWVNYLKSIRGKDVKEASYQFYIDRTKERNRYTEIHEYSGKSCFIYNIDDDKVYLHFNNNEGAEPGPLSKASIPSRLLELKNIFQDLYDNHPEATTVNGYSWLYNIAAYTRLFPPQFIENKTEVRDDFGFNIYGQFLNSSEEVKQDLSSEFLQNIQNAKTYEELINAFPFYPIRVSAPVGVFYYFYQVDRNKASRN